MLPTLESALNDPEQTVRTAAVESLGNLKGAALSILVQALERDNELARSIFRALGNMGPDAAPAVPAILRSPAAKLADSVIPAAWPALLNGMRDDNVVVRRNASRVVSSWAYGAAAASNTLELNAPELVAILKDGLKDTDDEVREHCMAGLNRLQVPPGQILPELIEALVDSNKLVRIHAASQFARWGSEADTAAMPALLRSLEDAEPDVRGLAAYAVSRMGPAAPESLARLRELMSDEVYFPRLQAAFALVVLEPGNEYGLPLLVNALETDDDHAQYRAASLLSELGPKAKNALPALRSMSKDHRKHVQNMAMDAIQKIESSSGGVPN